VIVAPVERALPPAAVCRAGRARPAAGTRGRTEPLFSLFHRV